MFESQTPYQAERIHAAAIYCSDGRVGEHFDDFLMHGLQLPRYDRVALPGGPATLVEYPQTKLEHAAVVDELQFLIEVHGLQRIVLIQHQNCAFYTGRLGLSGFEVEKRQYEDCQRAADFVRKITKIEAIESYFARQLDGRIRFERVQF
jgi:hypothetical protein